MRIFSGVRGILHQLSRASAQARVTTGHCKRCKRETRWIVDLGRGYIRCADCDGAPGPRH